MYSHHRSVNFLIYLDGQNSEFIKPPFVRSSLLRYYLEDFNNHLI